MRPGSPGLHSDPRLRILAPLGRGGMSDVWLAAMRGPAGFEKLVAVKQLRIVDEVDRGAAFLHEARLCARLNHPNIVQTFEIIAQGGDYRIIMEFLEGQPLNRILHRANGRVPLPDLVRVLVDVLSGLHYAHELTDRQGRLLHVVHRDVSPHNVFVTWEGGVKVLDFGVAAFERAEVTDEGLIKGKLTYMAPEQALGHAVDRRADLFAVGVLLWEFLAHRRMWQGLNDHTLYYQLTRGEVPDLEPLARGAPAELKDICARALTLDRDDRFATAAEMRHALESWLGAVGRPSPRHLGERICEWFAQDRERMSAIVAQGVPGDEEPLVPTDLFAPRATPAPAPNRPPISGPLTDGHEGPEVTMLTPQARLAPEPRRLGWLVPVSGALGMLALGALAVGAALAIGTAVAWEPLTERFAAVIGGAPARAPGAPCPPGPRPVLDLTGDIDVRSALACDADYRLQGVVRVLPGATLVIEPGTVVRAEPRSVLLVEPGGRIEAVGRSDAPIRFTSGSAAPRPGDWGGIVLLGRAPTNAVGGARVEGLVSPEAYGGELPDDSSGALKYVVIEYGGAVLAPNNETNGLTLAGVGRGTALDFVAVARPGDDCFEFFGGTVDAAHLVCLDPADDGFDIDQGYVGRLRALVLVDRTGGDGERNGIEVDNDPDGSLRAPRTAPAVEGVTLCGAAGRARPGFGLVVRRGALGTYDDLVVDGFTAGFDARDGGGMRVGRVAVAPQVPLVEPSEADDDQGLDDGSLVAAPGVAAPCAAPPTGGGGLRADDRWDRGWVGW